MKVVLFRDLPTEHWPSMERYADELTAALRGLGCEVQAFAPRRPWPGLRGRANALANYAWRYLAYPRAARAHQGDINHILDHSYGHLAPWLDARRTIVTCHDIAPLVFAPSGRGLGQALWRRSFQGMLGAARIITDSGFTREELLRQRDYPRERTRVVWLGVGQAFFSPAPDGAVSRLRDQCGANGRPLILHVGGCAPRKNVEAILRALPELSDLNPVFAQVGGQFSAMQRALRERLGRAQNVVQHTAVAEPDLRAWYQAADVFVFPSFYEGFGLPLLEAMASGTPVVCANSSSLLEVAGEAALLFEPGDERALADAVRRVMRDPTVRQALTDRGHARSREFTWGQTARKTLAVYTDIYRNPQ